MEILGIGMPELIFIMIIVLLVLGPRDMQKAGRSIGRFLNQLIKSDTWKTLRKSALELRNIPTNLMREANMEMQKTDAEIRSAMQVNQQRPGVRSMPVPQNPNTIDPPKSAPAPQTENKESESETQNNA